MTCRRCPARSSGAGRWPAAASRRPRWSRSASRRRTRRPWRRSAAARCSTGRFPATSRARHTGSGTRLLRDAGYASLGRAERADLHVRLAQWLEAIAGDRVAEVGAEIARHYADALEAAPALAPLLGGLDRVEVGGLARHWLVSAADRDAARFATAAAADGYRRAIGLTPDDDRLALAGLRRRLGAALASDDLDQAVEASLAAVADARAVLDAERSLGADVASAREILAGAAVGASTGRYEQVRFAEALAIADEALAVLGDGPGVDRIALARIRAREGLDNDYEALAAEARAIAERVGATGDDPGLAFDARRAALALDASSGIVTAAIWRDFADEAVRLGRLDVAASSLVNGAMAVYEDDRAAAFDQLDRAEDLAERYAFHDRLGWIGQTRTELGLASGDWDGATAAGRAAVDLGIRRSFHRIVVRTMSALTPIAHARDDRETLELAAVWFERWRSIFPGSPYGTVLHHAVDLRLAEAGLMVAPPVDEDRLAEGLALADDSPSWLAAVEMIVGSRVAAGRRRRGAVGGRPIPDAAGAAAGTPPPGVGGPVSGVDAGRRGPVGGGAGRFADGHRRGRA